jgi:DNA modification methylase
MRAGASGRGGQSFPYRADRRSESLTEWRVLVGDVREKLRELADQSVQCCVTSPPYWGLRNYGVDGQIGMEETPEAFVAEMVAVFREVRRVLKDDGTIWVNLGDSYLAQQGSGFNGNKRMDAANLNVKVARPAGMKPKDLAGIPWMVAFALRADGWYLRSDIIWSKPNPMPESVTDRPTKAHEYIFLLSKSPRYYYDAAAIRNPAAESTLKEIREGYDGQARKAYDGTGAQNPSSVKARIIAGKRDKQRGHGRRHAGFNDRWDAMEKTEQVALGSNARTVWSIATQPYPDAHFATFPEELPTRCIRAGSKPGDLILDPFTGSGTTGQVAIQLGRQFVGCELNPTYAELARKRIGGAAPLFATEASA